MTDHPVLVKIGKWAKWGSMVLGFVVLLWATGVATITTAVKWAAAPLIRAEAEARQEETRARQSGDSVIVSRLEAMDRKQDIAAAAMVYQYGSPERTALLRLIQRVEPQQIELPKEAKVEGKR